MSRRPSLPAPWRAAIPVLPHQASPAPRPPSGPLSPGPSLHPQRAWGLTPFFGPQALPLHSRCIPRTLSASPNFLPDPLCLSRALPKPQALAAFLCASLCPQDLLCSSVSPSRVWTLVPPTSSQDSPWTSRPFSPFFPCTPGLWSGFPGHLLGSPSLLCPPSFYPTSPPCVLYFVFTDLPLCSFRPVPALFRSAASLLIPSLPVFQTPFPAAMAPVPSSVTPLPSSIDSPRSLMVWVPSRLCTGRVKGLVFVSFCEPPSSLFVDPVCLSLPFFFCPPPPPRLRFVLRGPLPGNP